MADNLTMRHRPRLAVTFTIALLILSTIVFAVAFSATSLSESALSPAIDAQSYATEVAAALADALASEGETLIEVFQCSICHVMGEGRVAPSFTGMADRAEARRQPLSAAQYLYESIVSPGAYLVEGYANAMPGNFADRLTQTEIGHIIAYLLSISGGVSD
ncbi:MAG: c-type cytochrome [Chloroflexi bacterium]|nr:c-type cytochrome [Chloroflexota bacterium]